MSDLSLKSPVKIVDPDTDGQEAAVDSSGNLKVILASNTGVDVGDVDVATMPGTAAEAAALPSMFVVVAGDDGTDTHPLQLSATGDLQVELGAALPAGDNNIGNVDIVTLPNDETDDDAVAGAQSGSRVIGLNYGWDGTNWERLTTDTSGALDVNLTAALPAGSNNIGDVDVLTMPGTAAEDAALPAVFVVIAGDDGTDTHAIQVDATGNLKAVLQASDGTDIGDVDVASLPADTFVAEDGALGKGVLVQGDDGTDRKNVLVDTDGHLQVDVLTGGGSSTPTSPAVELDSSSGTAAGASADLDTSDQASNRDLWGIMISASVPWKAQVKKVEDDTPANLSGIVFGRANEAVYVLPPHPDFWTLTGGAAGLDAFRVTVTNMDGQKAADLHATFFLANA
jgi:hypothetical protein